MEPHRRLVISNLQALRAFAAVGVVFYHTGFVISGNVHTDFFGVMIFFIISGFIMTFITRSSDESFLTNRLIRIVPLYWTATVFVFAYGGLGFENPTHTFPIWWHLLVTSPPRLVIWFSNQATRFCTGDAVLHLATSLLFIPTAAPPLSGVGWTLNIEMFFYALFWASLKISRRFAPLIVCAVLVAFKVTPLRDLGPPGALYAHSYTTGFIVGVGSYYAWMLFERLRTRVSKYVVYAAVGVSWAIFLAHSLTDPPFIPIVYPYLVLPASIVFGALTMHSMGARISWRWLLLLGDASYALYLFHLNVLETMRSASSGYPSLNASSSVFTMLFALIASCLLAIGIYVAIERPLLRTLRQRAMSLPPKASPSISPAGVSVSPDACEAVRVSPTDKGRRLQYLLRCNWPVVVILILMLPSFYWIVNDHRIWPWEQAGYGERSVDLWFKFTRRVSEWTPTMLASSGANTPGIAWLGQFFVPLGRATRSIDTLLLCSILAIQIASIALFYQIAKELAPGRRLVAAVGILLFGSAPLFVGMSHQYLPEPLQLFGVTYFYFLAATGHRMSRETLLGNLLLATAIALLAKMNSPVYCVLPGLIASYTLFRKRNSKSETCLKGAYWRWLCLSAGVILCAACATWYARNLPALRETSILQASLKFAPDYVRPATFLERLSSWLHALQSSFQLRWVIVGQLILVGAGAALARIGGRDDRMKPPEAGERRFDLLTVCSVIQILAVLSLSSLASDEETRYLLPLLPAIATVNIWFICKIRQPWLLGGVIMLLCLQWVAICSQALRWGSIDRRTCSYWVIPYYRDWDPAKEVTRIAQQTAGPVGKSRLNIVGVELPWLNANSLSFFAAKEQLKMGTRSYYTSLGYVAKDLDLAWKRMGDLNVDYFISLEEMARPANPNFVNLTSTPALRRIRDDPDFAPEPFTSKLGVVLFKRRAASLPPATGAQSQ